MDRRTRTLRSTVKKQPEMTPFRQGVAAMQMQSPAPLLAKQQLITEEQSSFDVLQDENRDLSNSMQQHQFAQQPVIRKRSNLTEFIAPAPRQKIQAQVPQPTVVETPMFSTSNNGDDDGFERFLQDETPLKFTDPVTVQKHHQQHSRHDSNSLDSLPQFQPHLKQSDNFVFQDDQYDEEEVDEEYVEEHPVVKPSRGRVSLYLRRAVGLVVAFSVFALVFFASFHSILYIWNTAVPLTRSAYLQLNQVDFMSYLPQRSVVETVVPEIITSEEFVPEPHQGITVEVSDDVEEAVSNVEVFVEPVVSLNDRLQTIELALSQLSETLDKANTAAHSEQKMVEKLKSVVDEAIADYHRHQMVGYADYAFEKTGAKIVHSMTSKTFDPQPAPKESRSFFSSLFGSKNQPSASKRSHSNTPETAIRESVVPGSCWPFEGSAGQLTVQLAREIIPTNFTVEHILPVQALNNDVSSAPKQFQIFAIEKDESIMLGEYEYDTGSALGKQVFIVQTPSFSPVKAVQMKILSNHGNPQYTCLYRFQVHGFLSRN